MAVHFVQYRRTPLSSGYSPSELLNGCVYGCMPSPHTLPRPERPLSPSYKRTVDPQWTSWHIHTRWELRAMHSTMGMHGRDKDPRWVPPIITKVFGVRIVNNAMEWWSRWKEGNFQLQNWHASILLYASSAPSERVFLHRWWMVGIDSSRLGFCVATKILNICTFAFRQLQQNYLWLVSIIIMETNIQKWTWTWPSWA